MIKNLAARNNKYIFSLKANNSAVSFETIHGQEMLALTLPTVPAVQRDAPAAPAAGWGPMDWIAEWGPWPSQLRWGKGKETPGDWEKYHIFFPEQTRTMVTAAFCSEHKEDKATCKAALPVCRGFPLGRDHSALSINISLFSIMQVTFRDWLSMAFWPAMLPLPLQCSSSCTRNRESPLSWAGIYLSSVSSLIIIHQPKILWHLFVLLFKSPAFPLSLPHCNQQQDSGTGKDSARNCKGDKNSVFSCSSLWQNAALYRTTLVIPTLTPHRLRQKLASQFFWGKVG